MTSVMVVTRDDFLDKIVGCSENEALAHAKAYGFLDAWLSALPYQDTRHAWEYVATQIWNEANP